MHLDGEPVGKIGEEGEEEEAINKKDGRNVGPVLTTKIIYSLKEGEECVCTTPEKLTSLAQMTSIQPAKAETSMGQAVSMGEAMSTSAQQEITKTMITKKVTGVTMKEMATGVTTKEMATGVTMQEMATGVTMKEMATGGMMQEKTSGITMPEITSIVTKPEVTSVVTTPEITTTTPVITTTTPEITTTPVITTTTPEITTTKEETTTGTQSISPSSEELGSGSSPITMSFSPSEKTIDEIKTGTSPNVSQADGLTPTKKGAGETSTTMMTNITGGQKISVSSQELPSSMKSSKETPKMGTTEKTKEEMTTIRPRYCECIYDWPRAYANFTQYMLWFLLSEFKCNRDIENAKSAGYNILLQELTRMVRFLSFNLKNPSMTRNLLGNLVSL